MVVSADETPVKILSKDGVRTSAQAYMRQLSRWGPHPLILFEFDMSRCKGVAERLLGDYVGPVQIDAYAGYNILFGHGSTRIRVGCMAHVLRQFKDFLATLKKSIVKVTPPQRSSASLIVFTTSKRNAAVKTLTSGNLTVSSKPLKKSSINWLNWSHQSGYL
jgi:hypothetical protein